MYERITIIHEEEDYHGLNNTEPYIIGLECYFIACNFDDKLQWKIII